MHRPPIFSTQLLDMLVDDQLIDRDTRERILARTRDQWVPFGKILKQRGRLTMTQLMSLLEQQNESPELLLGELAVRAGYCTEEDVYEALRVQREISPHPLEVLVREVAVDRERLIAVFIRYVRRIEEQREKSTARRR